MRIVTPESLHYPITVTKLRQEQDDNVDRNAPLFDYYYKSKVIEGSQENKEGKLVERTWPSTFESYTEGTLTRWYIDVGKVIARAGTAVAEVEEPCKHEVQFGGMCANCGKDMTTVEYNTVTRDTARATVNTVHGHTALLVSQAEASKSDEEAKRRLISTRKLSLVVDLDQTIIHATVDPTVAEWQHDTNNPNHDAVKDVQAFQLIDDGPGARGCWYYIKLRPGLIEFLETISKYYELHIYTMGTRAYAQHIAKIVDPERRIFADRILSRDESGSLTVKNLKRLFPVDTKMVVIIDDRGDVWQWSQNLIKVSAYDFFVGIGDINSSFLPKRPELEALPPKPTQPGVDAVETQDRANGTTNGDAVAAPAATPTAEAQLARSVARLAEPQTNVDVSAIDQLVSMGGGDNPGKLQEQTSQQDETLAAQLADRPLLQKQKILDAAEDERAKHHAESGTTGETIEQKPDAGPQSQYRHNLLRDDDTELQHLQDSLQGIHQAFYEEYDHRLSGSQGGRIAELRPGYTKKRAVENLGVLPDVTAIMARMKQKVFKGVSLVFSGVVPLGVDIHNHDLAIWAKSFGANVTENMTKRTTHVIASPHRRTAKVRQAAKRRGKVHTVNQRWLLDSLSEWHRLSEEPYLIHSDINEETEKSLVPNGSPFDDFEDVAALSSSDEEAANTEEEGDTPSGLILDTAVDGTETEEELKTHIPTMSREDSSPNEETAADWEGMNDELADFLGSDIDDGSESEAESTKSDDTDEPATPASSAKKRKRKDDNISTDGDDSDASLNGSRLQKRKRKALARTTSLQNTATLTDRSSAKIGQVSQDQAASERQVDESDGDFEAELEAEMLRQALDDDGAGDDDDA